MNKRQYFIYITRQPHPFLDNLHDNPLPTSFTPPLFLHGLFRQLKSLESYQSQIARNFQLAWSVTISADGLSSLAAKPFCKNVYFSGNLLP